MTVYVDDMFRQARVGRLNGRWSHLLADSERELMRFALEMGLKSSWLQAPGTHRAHFDLTEPRRRVAISLGAVEISYPHGTAQVIARARERLRAEQGLG